MKIKKYNAPKWKVFAIHLPDKSLIPRTKRTSKISKKKTDNPLKKEPVKELKQALSQRISEKSTNTSKDAQFLWLKKQITLL